MINMGAVWDRTAEFLSDNLGSILPVALIAFFVPMSIQGNFERLGESVPALVVPLAIVQLAFSVLMLWGGMTIGAMALNLGTGESAGRIGRERLLPALGVSVLLYVAVLLLALPVVIALMANGVDLPAMMEGTSVQLAPGLGGGLFLYLLAALVFLLWLWARLCVVLPVILKERVALAAIPRSFALTRGATLRIIGVMLLFVLVFAVTALAAMTVFGAIFRLVAGGGEGGVTLAGVLTWIVVALVQTSFATVVYVYSAKLYLALVAAQERAAAA